ncbi:hypothetical protein [Streptomyces sp. NPDC101393]|uniref:hypothetical protein n=1 Tax=Streptomyces sp. NPDC101393 TaxID=3366141 RepID=UPI0038279549
MTQTRVPEQSGEPDEPPPSGPPGPEADPAPAPFPVTPPGASEATRLLCAGTYMDDGFRDAVIDELYVHEERFVAPSLGIDAARVLAHALRARRLQICWASLIVLLWIVAVPLSSGLASFYLFPVVLMALARAIRRAPVPRWIARFLSFLLCWYGRLTLAFFLLTLVNRVCGGDEVANIWVIPSGLPDFMTGDTSDYDPYGSSGGSGWPGGPQVGSLDPSSLGAGHETSLLPQSWITLALPLLTAVVVGLQRGQFARVLAGELSRARFPDVISDPAERSQAGRFVRLRDRVRIEQHGPLVMYRAADPFRGAGSPYKTWSLSVELRPRPGRDVEPLDNSAILQRIVPLVAALRVPSAHGSLQSAEAVRDRLRGLEIDECVFLPAEGLPTREAAPYAAQEAEAHRARAVEEGGETRRHFLRIRVGGWGEGIVTTVFVRVHTQGGMLMLEVAPHVLFPLRQDFQDADRLAHLDRHQNLFGKAVWALSRTPRSAGRAVVTLLRGLLLGWGMGTGGYGASLPDGPGVSVRELGASDDSSLFQDMDITRYLTTIQQRVAAGVTTALRASGYQTDEFEQRIVNVASGGVYVESAQGAVGIGDHHTITNNNNQGGSAPDEGNNRGNS